MTKPPMSRTKHNHSCKQTLHQQAYNKLNAMTCFGESKHIAKINGSMLNHIYSFSTLKTYLHHIYYFIDYLKIHHPNCTRLKDARKYIPEWLQYRINQGLSAWTIHTSSKALNKLYEITPHDPDYFICPPRKRANIRRSRFTVKSDKHFSLKNNHVLISFCKSTGLRRSELSRVRGADLCTRNRIIQELDILLAEKNPTKDTYLNIKMCQTALLFQEEFFIYVRRGKGGKKRYCPIIGIHSDLIIDLMQSTPADNRVWPHIHKNADIHAYRSFYASIVYHKYARNIHDIPYDKINAGSGYRYQSGVYHCKKDAVGLKLDRQAMLYASKALGHNRISVIASNYLKDIYVSITTSY